MPLSEIFHTGIIGLTGGMGSGKSAVAAHLCDLHGAKHIDADQVCRRLMEPHEKGWIALQDMFGEKYLGADQALDRQKLRHAIFHDERVRSQVNSLLHPLARDEIVRLLGRTSNPHIDQKVIVEVPLLFEAHWEKDFATIVVVYADKEQCLKRLIKRDQINREEAEAAIASQWPLSDKVLWADHVINNSGTWSATCLQLLHLGRLLWHDE